MKSKTFLKIFVFPTLKELFINFNYRKLDQLIASLDQNRTLTFRDSAESALIHKRTNQEINFLNLFDQNRSILSMVANCLALILVNAVFYIAIFHALIH